MKFANIDEAREIIGKVVIFNDNVKFDEVNSADPKWQARVTAVSPDSDKDFCKVTVDYSEFEEQNKQFAVANYYGNGKTPSLTCFESGDYEVSETYYIDFNRPVVFDLAPQTDDEKRAFALAKLTAEEKVLLGLSN